MITCREATSWLLEADLSELRAPGNHAAAEHIASCRGCSTRVARILGDTSWLSRAVPAVLPQEGARSGNHSPLRLGRWTFPTYVATALLAASLLFVFLTRNSRPERSSTPHAHRLAAASAAPRPTATDPVGEVERARVSSGEQLSSIAHRPASQPATRPLPSTLAVAPVAVRPELVQAIPTRAERLDALPADNGSTGVEARPSLAVDVTPSTGRYAILGSTPRVTVVWFY